MNSIDIEEGSVNSNHRNSSSTTNSNIDKKNSTCYIAVDSEINQSTITNDNIKNFRYVLRRKNNKNFKDMKDVQVTYYQVNGIDIDILSRYNLEIYSNLNHQEELVQFIVNIMIDCDLIGQILKFDEEQQVFRIISSEKIFDYLQVAFRNRCKKINDTVSKEKMGTKGEVSTKLRQKEKEKNAFEIGYNTSHNILHPINSGLKFGININLDPKEQDQWSGLICKANAPENMPIDDIKHMYANEKSHSLFSVIHPLFEEYDLIVYNASHRLDYSLNNSKRSLIHSCSRIKIRIPPPNETDMKSFFIIFNSRLVHAGSKTFRQGLLSSHHRCNFRLFAYCMQSCHDTCTKLLRLENYNGDLSEDYVHEHTRSDHIDHVSFDLCDPTSCLCCKKYVTNNRNLEGSGDIIIDVKHEYKYKKEKRKTKFVDMHKFVRPKSYICGDLDSHGWEVHVGIDYMKDKNNYKFLRFHLEALHQSSDRLWTRIPKSPGREYMKLTDLKGNLRAQTRLSRKYLNDICINDLSKRISQIRGFSNNGIQDPLLFVNKKTCQEQFPHRDFTIGSMRKSNNPYKTKGSNVQKDRTSKRLKFD